MENLCYQKKKKVLIAKALEPISSHSTNSSETSYNYLTLQMKKLGLRDEVGPSPTACK